MRQSCLHSSSPGCPAGADPKAQTDAHSRALSGTWAEQSHAHSRAQPRSAPPAAAATLLPMAALSCWSPAEHSALAAELGHLLLCCATELFLANRLRSSSHLQVQQMPPFHPGPPLPSSPHTHSLQALQSLLPSAATHTTGLLSHPCCLQPCSALLLLHAAPPISPPLPLPHCSHPGSCRAAIVQSWWHSGAPTLSDHTSCSVQPYVTRSRQARGSGPWAAPMGAGKQSPNLVHVQQKQ